MPKEILAATVGTGLSIVAAVLLAIWSEPPLVLLVVLFVVGGILIAFPVYVLTWPKLKLVARLRIVLGPLQDPVGDRPHLEPNTKLDSFTTQMSLSEPDTESGIDSIRDQIARGSLLRISTYSLGATREALIRSFSENDLTPSNESS